METDIHHAKGRDTVLDVAEEKVGRVYAEGFLGAAADTTTDGGAEAVEQLEAVVTEVLDRFPEFTQAIRSAFLSHEQREGMIDRVLRGRVAPVVVNTLKVLSLHDRLPLLRSVAREARRLFDHRAGRAPVEVTSASPLARESIDLLADMVREKLGIEPVVHLSVDPELIAGLQIRIDDTIFDGSLRTVFNKARQSIVEQTVAKIEQSPEHFLS